MTASPTILSPEALFSRLNWRAAVKKFDPSRRIPEATWQALEQSLVLSPSSYGLQPWKFFVVKDSAVRAKLRGHAWNQPQITDASHLVVFARRATMSTQDVDRHIDRMVEVRTTSRTSLDGYRTMMLGSISGKDQSHLSNWSACQVYIALGIFLASCAVLGVDACPMEGFDAAKFDEILGIPPQGYHATVVAAAGFRAANDPYPAAPKVRFKHTELVAHI
jgi:nitroreductase